eukprot:m.336379 g.336379  ORF g.336379 m.336379 type:complete len:243 (+) comp17836_c0_seq1:763-1491(+)
MPSKHRSLVFQPRSRQLKQTWKSKSLIPQNTCGLVVLKVTPQEAVGLTSYLTESSITQPNHTSNKTGTNLELSRLVFIPFDGTTCTTPTALVTVKGASTSTVRELFQILINTCIIGRKLVFKSHGKSKLDKYSICKQRLTVAIHTDGMQEALGIAPTTVFKSSTRVLCQRKAAQATKVFAKECQHNLRRIYLLSPPLTHNFFSNTGFTTRNFSIHFIDKHLVKSIKELLFSLTSLLFTFFAN